jgi:23S rRNA (adenine-N6)-dimethyltransferase
VSAHGRTPRDRRRRLLGQNFLDAATADRLIDQAAFRQDTLVVEIGAGSGAITSALARRGVRLITVEPDPVWSWHLRKRFEADSRVHIVGGDFLSMALPNEPFRVVGSLPFGRTTDILRCLLDDPAIPMERADVIVQWEVARKRSRIPPSTLLSTIWAPWWQVRLSQRIAAAEFRPVPRVDAGLLVITRRDPPILPISMASAYAGFVREHWPFV